MTSRSRSVGRPVCSWPAGLSGLSGSAGSCPGRGEFAVGTTAEPGDRRDPFERMLTDLRPLATATNVSRDGAAYHFRFGDDGKVLSGTATITGGRIETLAIGPGPGHGWATQTVISDYDQAPVVDPPPADKILDQDDLRQGTIDPAISDLLAE